MITILSSAVLLALLAFLFAPDGTLVNKPPSNAVQRVQWHDKLSGLKMAEVRTPAVTSYPGVSSWPAAQWTWTNLENRIENLKDVRSKAKGERPLFFPASVKDGQLPHIQMMDHHKLSNFTGRDFFRSTKDAEYYRYYSGPLENIGLESEVPQRSILPFDLTPKDIPLDKDFDFVSTSAWLSSEGVTAQTHYDKSHNFHTQLYGKKKWLLWPPTSWPFLKPYPALHPHYHQSQETEYIGQESDRLEVTLEAGETLYVPPYWFHRVESTTNSISVTVLSPSEEEVLCSDASWTAIPLGEEENDSTKLKSLITFLTIFLSELHAHPQEFLWYVIIMNRYSYMLSELKNFSRFGTAFGEGSCKNAMDRVRLDERRVEELSVFATEAAEKFDRLASIQQGVRESCAADFIEQLVGVAVGPEEVPEMLLSCFSLVDVPNSYAN